MMCLIISVIVCVICVLCGHGNYTSCTSVIYTTATANLNPGFRCACRTDGITADAAYAMLTKASHQFTGNFCIDEEVLRNEGVTDFDQYKITPGIDIVKVTMTPAVS